MWFWLHWIVVIVLNFLKKLWLHLLVSLFCIFCRNCDCICWRRCFVFSVEIVIAFVVVVVLNFLKKLWLHLLVSLFCIFCRNCDCICCCRCFVFPVEIVIALDCLHTGAGGQTMIDINPICGTAPLLFTLCPHLCQSIKYTS